MEHHRYNLISFAGSEYTDIAPMQITPQPDSILRVLVVFKELDEPLSVPEQTFPAPFEERVSPSSNGAAARSVETGKS